MLLLQCTFEKEMSVFYHLAIPLFAGRLQHLNIHHSSLLMEQSCNRFYFPGINHAITSFAILWNPYFQQEATSLMTNSITMIIAAYPLYISVNGYI